MRVWQGSKSTDVRVTWDTYPDGVIDKALKRFSDPDHGTWESPTKARDVSRQALKICGTSEYLLAARPITQYKVRSPAICQFY